ncbi:TetR/AcrR family transcriptional regulator [Streptomyces sp. NPDC048664]|uniref:TetR/AcrR family transcriptional regulator n=1 Tax=Streptomyces sp. NPDC048664 TaxID=3154505 RepID=UPI0034178C11
MPRPPDPAKRLELLDRVREYVVRHGLAGLSLRPMARALGTSDRMLLYYFGTKERLVSEALALDERRPMLRFASLLEDVGPVRDAATLRRFLEEVWRQLGAPDRRAMLPLYFELMAVSLMDPDRYGPLFRSLLSEWTGLLTPLFRGLGMSEEAAREEAALVVGSAFGLVFAPLADGDWDRADRAFRVLLDRFEPHWSTGRGAGADA